MSFFDLPNADLDRADRGLAVYTWGEESYDGLGDALQERGDELNDETFGSVDQVGMRPPTFSPVQPPPTSHPMPLQGKTLISPAPPFPTTTAGPQKTPVSLPCRSWLHLRETTDSWLNPHPNAVRPHCVLLPHLSSSLQPLVLPHNL
jgi:hypothetical protein